MKHPVILLLAIVGLLGGCDRKKSESQVVRREGEPDYIHVDEHDAEMDKAIETARQSVDAFIAALKHPAAGQTHFAVKKPVKEGEMEEHLWLSPVQWDGTRFTGVVNNDPVDVKGVKFGQKLTVTKDELSDWFYVENGKLIGGYTIRVLYSRMSPAEKRDFASQAHFRIE